MDLVGKKILFFCPIFFGYEKEIILEMQKMGAEIIFRSAQANEKPWFKAFIRIFPRLAWNCADKYMFSWLNTFSPLNCDIVFVVKGEGLSPFFLKELKSRYPKAKFVLHLWDSISNCKYIEDKFEYFDYYSSFDFRDCKKYSFFYYRPLFFINKYLNKNCTNCNKEIFFIATLNGDRPKVLKKIIDVNKKHAAINYWLFVRSRFELSIRKIIDKSLRKLDKSRLLLKPMPPDMIKKHLDECSCVLDIQHPKQTGLTIRTFEVIASNKKLITTNNAIKEHEFYDPKRIFVVSRANPIIPLSFLKSKNYPVPESFIGKYSLNAWLLDIFKEC